MLKTIFFSLSVLVCRILLLPLENKIHIFVPPFNIFYQLELLWLPFVGSENGRVEGFFPKAMYSGTSEWGCLKAS